MITRQQIIDELNKYPDKPKEFKKEQIQVLIAGENEEDQLKIISDLESYEQY